MKGQSPCSGCEHNPENPTPDTQEVSKNQDALLTAQNELIDWIMSFDKKDLSNSFKLIQDLVIYHCELPIEEQEKKALYFLKILINELEKIDEQC